MAKKNPSPRPPREEDEETDALSSKGPLTDADDWMNDDPEDPMEDDSVAADEEEEEAL